MTYVRIDVSEVRALARDITSHADGVLAKAEEVIAVGGSRTVAIAQQLAPSVTGTLRASISADVSGLSFEVGPTAFYGGYVEEGTAAHLEPDAFGWGFTVMHPADAAEPFMGPAFDRVEPVTVEALARLGESVLG